MSTNTEGDSADEGSLNNRFSYSRSVSEGKMAGRNITTSPSLLPPRSLSANAFSVSAALDLCREVPKSSGPPPRRSYDDADALAKPLVSTAARPRAPSPPPPSMERLRRAVSPPPPAISPSSSDGDHPLAVASMSTSPKWLLGSDFEARTRLVDLMEVQAGRMTKCVPYSPTECYRSFYYYTTSPTNGFELIAKMFAPCIQTYNAKSYVMNVYTLRTTEKCYYLVLMRLLLKTSTSSVGAAATAAASSASTSSSFTAAATSPRDSGTPIARRGSAAVDPDRHIVLDKQQCPANIKELFERHSYGF